MTRFHSGKQTRTAAIASLVNVLCGALVMCGFASAVSAQTSAKDFPNKRIRIIIPFTPGGPPDFSARVISPKLSAIWGQPVVV